MGNRAGGLKMAWVEEGLGGRGPVWKRAWVEEGLRGRGPAVAKMACGKKWTCIAKISLSLTGNCSQQLLLEASNYYLQVQKSIFIQPCLAGNRIY